MNSMWIPTDSLLNEINEYVNTNFKGFYMIGIQLRYLYLNPSRDTPKFVNCSFGIEEIARKSIKNFNEIYKGVKWFVTSDNLQFLQDLQKSYPNKILVGVGTHGHVLHNPDSYKRSIMDVELMGKCNETIITGGSTYGFVAAMKTLKLPYYINGGEFDMKKCIKVNLGTPPKARVHPTPSFATY